MVGLLIYVEPYNMMLTTTLGVAPTIRAPFHVGR